MVRWLGVRYRVDTRTGAVTALNDNGSPVPVSDEVAQHVRYAFARSHEAYGYAYAAQDTSGAERSEATAEAFAREFTLVTFAHQLDMGDAWPIADAWATWLAHGRLNVPPEEVRRFERPTVYTAKQIRNGTRVWMADARFIVAPTMDAPSVT